MIPPRDPAPPAAAAEAPIPRLQQLFESIPFLIFIGLVLPTLSYTLWSLAELVTLPTFGESAVHGSPHAGVRQDAAASEATATTGVVTPGTSVAPDAVRVSMRNMAFAPKVLEIAAGTTVTWTNDDPFPHAVAHGTPETPREEKLFYSGDYPGGSSFSYTFEMPGSYEVYCSTIGHYAAGMTMTVIVKE